MNRAEIIEELRKEALDDPECGWLSGLAWRGLKWDEFNEEIDFSCTDGSVDVGHLAEIVEHLIAKATKEVGDDG